jgi:hypothetical protein
VLWFFLFCNSYLYFLLRYSGHRLSLLVRCWPQWNQTGSISSNVKRGRVANRVSHHPMGGSEGNLIGLRRGKGGGPECWALVSQRGGIQYPPAGRRIKGSPPPHYTLQKGIEGSLVGENGQLLWFRKEGLQKIKTGEMEW